ncbi:MAG: sigma-70 family RNA polymerase sigma factor [Candidatus Ozemobacteraceae bacterium]
MTRERDEEDARLVSRVLAGEVNVYGILVEQYERLVFSYLLPRVRSLEEVEDLAQEIFLKAYRHLDSFDLQRRFAPWLMRIARNFMIDSSQKNVRIPHGNGLATEIFEHVAASGPMTEPHEKLEAREEFRGTFRHMLDLPEDLRIPFLLRVLQELSYEEIAELIDLPLQTVKNRIFKARSILRDQRQSEDERL